MWQNIEFMYWYDDEIKQLEGTQIPIKGKNKRVVFYGSSSIRLWENLSADFPEFETINRGFGGSTLAACCWFFKRLIPQLSPDIMVIYAGDNDLGDGRHPEEVYLNFLNMTQLINRFCGPIPVGFISVKSSLSRIQLYNSIEYTNKIIKAEIDLNYPACTFIDVNSAMHENGVDERILYESDGLHLSSEGYKIWAKELRLQFLEKFIHPLPNTENLIKF